MQRQARAGRARLRDGGAVQPVFGAGRVADRQRRLGRAADEPAARLSGRQPAAAARDVRAGT